MAVTALQADSGALIVLSAAFDKGGKVIPWHRVADFQLLSLEMIAVRMLHCMHSLSRDVHHVSRDLCVSCGMGCGATKPAAPILAVDERAESQSDGTITDEDLLQLIKSGAVKPTIGAGGVYGSGRPATLGRRPQQRARRAGESERAVEVVMPVELACSLQSTLNASFAVGPQEPPCASMTMKRNCIPRSSHCAAVDK